MPPAGGRERSEPQRAGGTRVPAVCPGRAAPPAACPARGVKRTRRRCHRERARDGSGSSGGAGGEEEKSDVFFLPPSLARVCFPLLSGQLSWRVRPRGLRFVLVFSSVVCNFWCCGCVGTVIVRTGRCAERSRILLVFGVLYKYLKSQLSFGILCRRSG